MRRCRFRAPRRALFTVPVVATLVATLVAVNPAGAQVTGVPFKSVVAGNTNGCALSSGGALYCWGDDSDDQMLDGGGSTEVTTPTLVDLSSTLASATISSYATGNRTTCILTSKPTVDCWGYNGQGEAGSPSGSGNPPLTTPTAIQFNGTPTGSVTQLVGGGDKTFCALTSTSEIWCWGGNESGQLGDDTSANSDEAVQVVTTTGLSGKTISSIAGWSDTFCAVASSGEAFCWGAGNDWNLGDGSETNSNEPVQVQTSSLPNGVVVKSIAPSSTHTCLLDSQDNVWCWGSNINGVNGLGDQDGSIDPPVSWFSIPQKVTSLAGLGVTSIVSSDVNSCALTSAGAMYCWGAEPIGDGNQNGVMTSPELITAGAIIQRTLTDVSVGDYEVCTVDSQASLYCWGSNNYGQIGDGSTTESVTSEEIATGPSATTISTVPNSPLNLQVLAYANETDLTWSPPYDDGGSAVTSYTGTAVDVATSDSFTCAGVETGVVWGCDITGLTVAHSYVVSVTATSNTGTSVFNSVGPTLLPDVPDAPTLDSVHVTTSTITATWTPGASDNGQAIEAFTVTAVSQDLSNECTGSVSQTTCTMTFTSDIPTGTVFNVTVEATNNVGNSAPSNVITAVLGNPPDPPQNGGAFAGSHQVAVSWTAPISDGGTPITGYLATATAISGSSSCLGGALATSCTITALTNGDSYDVTVVAQNEAGNSTIVDVGTFEPIGPPEPPTLTKATPGVSEITATWSAPANDGGEPVESYLVTAASTGAPVTCSPTLATNTSCVLADLTDGTSYSITVTATNAKGTSTSSNSLSATPGEVPTVPSFSTVKPATGSVTLTWNPPSSNGGDVITKYVVTSSPASAGCSVVGFTCTVTKLVPEDKYTFKLLAVNAVGNSPSATSITLYPYAPRAFAAAIASPVVSRGAWFPIVVGHAKAGSTVTFTTRNAGVIRCTANALGQCGLTEKQNDVGKYSLVVADGSSKYSVTYYVPLLTAPSSGKVNTLIGLKLSDAAPNVAVTINVDGKNYSARTGATGLATVNIKVTKTGTYTVTTTVDGVVLSPTEKIKIIT